MIFCSRRQKWVNSTSCGGDFFLFYFFEASPSSVGCGLGHFCSLTTTHTLFQTWPFCNVNSITWLRWKVRFELKEFLLKERCTNYGRFFNYRHFCVTGFDFKYFIKEFDYNGLKLQSILNYEGPIKTALNTFFFTMPSRPLPSRYRLWVLKYIILGFKIFILDT